MKKFKSVLVFLLSLIICFSVFPTTVFAQNFFDVNLDNYESSVRLKDGRFTYGNPPSNLAFGTYGELSVFDYAFVVDKYPLLSKGNIFHIEFDLLSPFYLNLNSTNVVLDGYTSQSTDAKSITVYAESIDITSDTLSIDFVLTQDIYLVGFRIRVVSSDVKYTCSGSTPFKFQISNCTNSLSSETQSLGNKISKFFTDLFNRLTSWFDSLFQWLKDIRDGNISFMDSVKSAFKTITDNIRNFFSELGKKLTDGFTNLTNSIRDFFTNLGNNLKDWFDDVGQWFTDIGDRIGEFFTSLWNKIWYGNEKGESEYQKPVINNKFNDILETLTEYQEQLKGTISTISASADSVSTYIATGTQLVNGVINVAGAGFTALIVFGMVFVLVRKVVGR